MTRRSGYALLTALVAVIALVCTAIVVSVGGSGTAIDDAASRPRAGATAAGPAVAGTWVGTWGAAPAAAQPGAPHGYPGRSIRDVVHASAGGAGARVHLSNLFGTMPLTLTHVTLAVGAGPGGPDALPDTVAALTFDGRASVTIAPGAGTLSDPVRIQVPAGCDLLITTYTPYATGPVTYHPHARQTSYLARGDHTGDVEGTAFTEQSPYWRYVTAVDVWSGTAKGTVVALGDSITDGVTSTVGADHRWPDYLAERLRASTGGPQLGVLDEGISGNRLLSDAEPGEPWDGPSTLSRLERDALSQTGVRTLVVDIGINDIMEIPRRTDAGAIIAGLREITHEAHARGVRVVGATLTPFRGQRDWTPRLDAVREQVNAAIRGGHLFDAVADFDQALRDPGNPDRLLPRYDSGDHIHPGDAGYRAMADAITLPVLTGSAPADL